MSKDKDNNKDNQIDNDAKTSNTTSLPRDKREYTLVLYGATSFVGQITAHYLTQFLLNSHANSQTKWAIAGRNKTKLETLKNELLSKANTADKNAANLPDIMIADSNDDATLTDMCQQTVLVISTVGPYLLYGEPLIKACAQNGTDYVDLTGEAIFIKDMLDKYQHIAKKSGARIVNSCGFDSIPSDLGVYFTQKQAQHKFNAPCTAIHMRVKAAKGGLSGGTVSSMATIFAEASKDKKRRKQIGNPYLLNDDTNAPSMRQPSNNKPSFDATHNRWNAPFIMESINTRIVHRSNQLLNYTYGRDFKYNEAMWLPAGRKGQVMSYAITAGIGGFAVAMSFDKSRELLSKHVLPKSGDGPSKQEQENGYFDVRFFGYVNHDNDISIATKVTGDKDPGYGSTSKMLAQAGLCLAQDIMQNEVGGGFWTPAAAMGDKLIERLQHHAGLEFSVI